MKKSLILKILYLFLVLIIVAGASVFATNTYLASQVSYGSTTVENALNDLYTLKGNDENYSTEERIVGKWINEKNIYRIVLTNISVPQCKTTGTNAIKELDISDLNINEITDLHYSTKHSGDIYDFNNFSSSGNPSASIRIRYDKINKKLNIFNAHTNWNTSIIEYLILEYTK